MSTLLNQCHNITLAQLIPEVNLPDDVSNLVISSVVSDSREVKANTLYCGLSGARFTSRQFITDAVNLGAAAIIIDAFGIDGTNLNGCVVEFIECQQRSVPVISIANLRAQLSAIAGRFYRYPSHNLLLVGVTGTNGKSSCVGLITHIWQRFNIKAASIGTLGYGDDMLTLTGTGMTTPDAIACQRILAEFNQNDISHVSMEVSSHGIDQSRVSALQFAVAVITNITRDHLDYHETFEEYARVKASFISSPGHGAVVVNVDDVWCKKIIEDLDPSKTFSYSLSDMSADVYVILAVYTAYGITARISTPWGSGVIRSKLVGEFNLSNLLAVVATACISGLSFQHVLRVVTQIDAIPGRMQKVLSSDARLSDITVCVDFAHTPDALEKVMTAVRQFATGELWVVFGCGGDRDRGKRDAMGLVVSMLADRAVVTSDNPRSEEPQAIIDDIVNGMLYAASVVTIVEREAAIAYAIKNAAPGAAILVAGKGHEAYQEIKGVKTEFDDVCIAKKYLDARIALLHDSPSKKAVN